MIPPGHVIRMKFITRKYVQEHPDVLFAFGDNMARIGMGGQAGHMRGEPNSIGIPTKWSPNLFFNNKDWSDPTVIDEIYKGFYTIEEALKDGKSVVIPSDGLGTGLAGLPERAPLIFRYIDQRIASLEKRYP